MRSFYGITEMPTKKMGINAHRVINDSMEVNGLNTKTNEKLNNDRPFKLKQLHNNIYVDITAIDRLDFKRRFSLTYILLELRTYFRTIINIGLKSTFAMMSKTLSDVFYGVGAAEREIYDLFGIFFTDHPDLRRVLTDYGFKGNPLKKDFPLTGTTELFFSVIKKILIFKPIKLAQEMRIFDYDSPWLTNNDFFNYSKSEKEEDIEMEFVSKITSLFVIFIALLMPDLRSGLKKKIRVKHKKLSAKKFDQNKTNIIKEPSSELKINSTTDNLFDVSQILSENNSSLKSILKERRALLAEKHKRDLADQNTKLRDHLIADEQRRALLDKNSKADIEYYSARRKERQEKNTLFRERMEKALLLGKKSDGSKNETKTNK